MSCPTCGHTLEGIGHGMYHCPRCGTLVAHPRCLLAVPKLVERCRRFERYFREEDACLANAWQVLGIEESISPPEERSQPS